MPFRAPAAVQLKEPIANRFGEQVRQALRELELVPFLSGIPVNIGPLAAPDVITVDHLLGRAVSGWFPLYVERDPVETAAFTLTYRTGDIYDDRQVQLWASTAFLNAQLWVF